MESHVAKSIFSNSAKRYCLFIISNDRIPYNCSVMTILRPCGLCNVISFLGYIFEPL